MKPAGALVCRSCAPKLVYVRQPLCMKCGKELSDENQEYCRDCLHKKHLYDRGISLYRYTSVKKAVYRFKYAGRQEYAAFFGKEMAWHLAHGIAQKLGCPVETKLVVRAKNTVPLKSLNDTQRKKNLENAFKIRKNGVKLNKILLIDDIYTTGSTIDAMAAVCRQQGVSRIYFAALSIGNGQEVR